MQLCMPMFLAMWLNNRPTTPLPLHETSAYEPVTGDAKYKITLELETGVVTNQILNYRR